MSTREVSITELRAAQSLGWAAREAGSDYLWARLLDDGRGVYLMPLLFGNLRLGIGPHDSAELHHVWDYRVESGGIDAAWRAALGWDGQGEPEGWYRGPGGRRRPDGTAKSERVGDETP
jgi:hypothetical protein